MDILVYGAGYYYRKYRPFLEQANIIAIIDNDIDKQGRVLDGHIIMSVEEGLKQRYDKIIVFGKYANEKRRDLKKRGVETRKICGKEFILENANSERIVVKKYCPKKVFIIVYDLDLNGATIAGVEAGKVIRSLGYSVTFASPSDGPVREKLLSYGFEVIIDNRIIAYGLADFDWCNEADLVWINTINLFDIFFNRDVKMKVVLWLHDPEYSYKTYGIKGEINTDNVFVYAVGDIAINAFKQNINAAAIPEKLLYYIEDFKKEKKAHKKFIFAIVGLVCENKNQALFIKAASKFSENALCEFWIIGNTTSKYASELKGVTKDERIIFFNEVDRDRLKELYREIDALVVTSIEDVMPIVATEAMMNEIGCIVSENVGTANMITKENGLKFKPENSDDLFKKMKWVYNNQAEWKVMGGNARKTYESKFSKDVFTKNIKDIFFDIGI